MKGDDKNLARFVLCFFNGMVGNRFMLHVLSVYVLTEYATKFPASPKIINKVPAHLKNPMHITCQIPPHTIFSFVAELHAHEWHKCLTK
jgi:hypothetical protein